MKRKELRRLISHFLKLNSQMTGSSTKVLTQLQAKIHYLDIISGLPSYGAKCFSTNQRDGVERVLLVSPRFGLSQIAGSKNSVVSIIWLFLMFFGLCNLILLLSHNQYAQLRNCHVWLSIVKMTFPILCLFSFPLISS